MTPEGARAPPHVRLTSPGLRAHMCTGMWDQMLTGVTPRPCRDGTNSHRPAEELDGPDEEFLTDPGLPWGAASKRRAEGHFRPLPCPFRPQVNGAQHCLVARSSAWPSPAPSSSSQRC